MTSGSAYAFTGSLLRRFASNWPRATKDCTWSSRRLRRSEVFHADIIVFVMFVAFYPRPHSRPRGLIRCGRLARRRRLDAGSALLLGRSDRPRTGVAGCLEGFGLPAAGPLRDVLQPVRHRALQADGPPRQEYQHHRRGAGFELVYEPDRRHSGYHRADYAWSDCRASTRPLELGADP